MSVAFALCASLATASGTDWHLPAEPEGHVNDYAGSLASATKQSLELQLTQHEDATGNQVVVVIVPTLAGRDIADVAYEIGDRWHVGQRGKDNGVVFLVALSERRTRIDVGKGLEGSLTDLQAHVILDEIVKPAFVAGAIADGVRLGTVAIIQSLKGELHPAATSPRVPWWISLGGALLVLVLFLFFPRAGMLLLLMGGSRRGTGSFSGGGGRFGGGGASGSW